ncbi:MAG: protoporphyrinogen oxidase [bacterium]|nr:protoporphyrinogen oxidase [bacterium]
MTPVDPRRAAVVGGGITGLACAYALKRLSGEAGRPVAITLLEGDERLGGCILTERVEDCIIDGGPDSFLAEKPWARELCVELGIEGRLIGLEPAGRRIYVLSGGRLHPLPEGFVLAVPTAIGPLLTSSLFSWPGKLRIVMERFIRARPDADDESLASFIRRRLGREALEKVGEPLVAGIHAGDAETLSLRATFPRFLDMERRYGSLIRGMRARMREVQTLDASGHPPSPFLTLAGGLGELVDCLAEALDGVDVRLATHVEAVDPSPSGGWRLQLAGGKSLEAEAVALAVPSWQAARLLTRSDPHLAGLLETIPWVSSATVVAAWRREDVGRPLDGSGFVAGRGEGRSITACTWSSAKFSGRAPPDRVLVRAFVGGAKQEHLAELDDEALVARVRADVDDILAVRGEPLFVRIFRWPRAMPQYTMGHLERVAAIEAACERHPGLALAGASYRGLGIPDCIHQGRQAAERLLQALASP